MKRLFTNLEIFEMASQLKQIDFKNNYIPVGINFYIQKNIKEIAAAAQVVETARAAIVSQYGTSEDGSHFSFEGENMEKASKELNELQSIKQEIDIEIIPLSKLLNLEITTEQLQAILFMIEDDVHKVCGKGE